MRSLWKGSISFGLVNIPVKMYTASQSHTLDMDMVHYRFAIETKNLMTLLKKSIEGKAA